jgi:cysteine desulfurase
MGLRPGGENVPACIGLGAAAALATRGIHEVEANLTELRERLINGVLSSINPAAKILFSQPPMLPNTVLLELPASARQVQRFARSLAVATAQSSTPPDEMTRVLREVGYSDAQIGRMMRLSVGWTTTRDQIDRAVELLADACDNCVAS